MQKTTHKFEALRKQHSIILVNPVTDENNLFAGNENWLLQGGGFC